MYLEQRYNRKVRLVASGVSTVGSIFIMAMFVYIPALAFNQGECAIDFCRMIIYAVIFRHSQRSKCSYCNVSIVRDLCVLYNNRRTEVSCACAI